MAGKQGGKAQVIEQKGDLSLREHGQMGKIQRAQVARKRKVLQQAQPQAHNRRGVRARPKGVGSVWLQKPRRLSRHLSRN